MTRGRLIGRGRLAEVFAWGDHEVIKLFYPGRPKEPVEREADKSRVAYESGLSTPAVGETVEVDEQVRNRLRTSERRFDVSPSRCTTLVACKTRSSARGAARADAQQECIGRTRPEASDNS